MSTYVGKGTLYVDGVHYFDACAPADFLAAEQSIEPLQIEERRFSVMQRSNPFARATAIFALVAAAAGDLAKRAALPEYQSRGKGLCRHSGKKWGPQSSGKNMILSGHKMERRWMQIENGAREVARRQRQIAAGKLQCVPAGAV